MNNVNTNPNLKSKDVFSGDLKAFYNITTILTLTKEVNRKPNK